MPQVARSCKSKNIFLKEPYLPSVETPKKHLPCFEWDKKTKNTNTKEKGQKNILKWIFNYLSQEKKIAKAQLLTSPNAKVDVDPYILL